VIAGACSDGWLSCFLGPIAAVRHLGTRWGGRRGLESQRVAARHAVAVARVLVLAVENWS
jgi:hypothetical protein